MAICEQNSGANIPVGPKDGYDFNHGSDELPHDTVDLTRSKCDSARPVIHCRQGQAAKLTLWVTDRNGAAIDLTAGGPFVIEFVAKDRAMNNTKIIDATGDIDDAETGRVTVVLTSNMLAYAGIYVAQLFVKNDNDDTLWVTDYWLDVPYALDLKSTGPITIPEVRLILRDSCPGQNILLEDFEFDDSQIMACMRLPVDEFNERFQPKTNYVPRNFPFRFHWLRATAGYLLEIAGRGYARDQLPYNAGGVSVDDKNKASIYMQMADQLVKEWRQFIKERKVELNIEGGYSSYLSGYSTSMY